MVLPWMVRIVVCTDLGGLLRISALSFQLFDSKIYHLSSYCKSSFVRFPPTHCCCWFFLAICLCFQEQLISRYSACCLCRQERSQHFLWLKKQQWQVEICKEFLYPPSHHIVYLQLSCGMPAVEKGPIFNTGPYREPP